MNFLMKKLLIGFHFFIILISFAISVEAGKIKELLILAEDSIREELSYLGDIDVELRETQIVEINSGIKVKTIAFAITSEKDLTHNFYCEVDFHKQNEKWTPIKSMCK